MQCFRGTEDVCCHLAGNDPVSAMKHSSELYRLGVSPPLLLIHVWMMVHTFTTEINQPNHNHYSRWQRVETAKL